MPAHQKKLPNNLFRSLFLFLCQYAGPTGMNGAKDGTRTRDPDLGKVVLYQLSYFRNMFVI